MSCIRCKCNQNLERTATGRRSFSITCTINSFIAESVAEGDDKYSLDGAFVYVYSNGLEGVVFVLLEHNSVSN